MVEIFSSKELGGGWRVSIARDDGGWRLDDFLNRSGANRMRVVPPEPVTAIRHASLELALHAARRWLHAERLF